MIARDRLRRWVVGPPRRDVGTAEWDLRSVVVGLLALLVVFGVALALVPEAVGWRLLALAVAVIVSQVAERRFRRWRRAATRVSRSSPP
jgi:hypothetical protein